MIYFAEFVGRKIHADGIHYPITAYCYGDDEEKARLDLYNRYDHIQFLKLKPVPVVTVGDCKSNDMIYMIEDGKTVGDRKPHDSFYVVVEHSPIVCSGEYAEHVTCRNGAGILVPVARTLECIVVE